MPGQRKEIENKLKTLPDSFTAKEILVMYDELKKDIAGMKTRGVPMKTMEMELHKKHSTLAYSYPIMFFRVIRGELPHEVFLKMMYLKNKVDKGKVSNEDAKKKVIDHTREYIEAHPERKNLKKDTSKLESQEFAFKCKLEDDKPTTIVEEVEEI